jgi:hypothetical protein
MHDKLQYVSCLALYYSVCYLQLKVYLYWKADRAIT